MNVYRVNARPSEIIFVSARGGIQKTGKCNNYSIQSLFVELIPMPQFFKRSENMRVILTFALQIAWCVVISGKVSGPDACNRMKGHNKKKELLFEK